MEHEDQRLAPRVRVQARHTQGEETWLCEQHDYFRD